MLRPNLDHPGMIYAEPISSPVNNQIPHRIQRRIWANRYVDLAQLLPNTQNQINSGFDIEIDRYSRLNLVPKQKIRKTYDINMWTSTFIRFGAVYTERNEGDAPSLFKYMEVVRDLANRQHGLAFYHYDMAFRAIRQNSTLNWDSLHTVMGAIRYQQSWSKSKFSKPT